MLFVTREMYIASAIGKMSWKILAYWISIYRILCIPNEWVQIKKIIYLQFTRCLHYRPWAQNWPRPATIPRRPKMMFCMQRMWRPAGINTRPYARSARATPSSVLMSLSPCEVYTIPLNHPTLYPVALMPWWVAYKHSFYLPTHLL